MSAPDKGGLQLRSIVLASALMASVAGTAAWFHFHPAHQGAVPTLTAPAGDSGFVPKDPQREKTPSRMITPEPPPAPHIDRVRAVEQITKWCAVTSKCPAPRSAAAPQLYTTLPAWWNAIGQQQATAMVKTTPSGRPDAGWVDEHGKVR